MVVPSLGRTSAVFSTALGSLLTVGRRKVAAVVAVADGDGAVGAVPEAVAGRCCSTSFPEAADYNDLYHPQTSEALSSILHCAQMQS
jgi:hypothetical protein